MPGWTLFQKFKMIKRQTDFVRIKLVEKWKIYIRLTVSFAVLLNLNLVKTP